MLTWPRPASRSSASSNACAGPAAICAGSRPRRSHCAIVDGEVIGILGTFEDVTERRAAEERLNGTLKDLDKRVQQRTRDLERAIESLRREVDDRVRVQAEERQQRAYAEALRDTASAMSKTLDANEVMEQVLIGVERLVSNDLTAIVLVGADERLEIARCRVGFGYPKPTDGAEGSVAVDVADRDRELHDDRETVIIDEPAEALGPAGSVLGAALQVGDRRIGFVVLESVTKGFFTTAHAERLRAIADQAASAISNARLVGQASELAAAEERQRLSRELHDAVNQTLWTASLTADSVLRDVEVGSELHRRLQRLRTLTSGAQAEMRTLLLELRPQELVEVDLHELLGHLVAAMECRKKVEVTVDLEPIELDPAQRVAFYRIAQEALTNITRHSAASVVSFTLGDAPMPSRPAARAAHRRQRAGLRRRQRPAWAISGLSIMRERAEAIGADLRAQRRPGPRHRAHRVLAVNSITVLVVDDHDLLREGVSSCLSSFDDLEVIGEAASGEDGLEAASRLRPDVVVIDLIMPGIGRSRGDQADARRQRVDRLARPQHVRPRRPDPRERSTPELAATSSSRSGRTASPKQSAMSLPAEARSPATSPGCSPHPIGWTVGVEARFTDREAEVATLMADGRSNAEIADALSLSVFTVKNHVSSILMKLHAQSRTEAAAIILRGTIRVEINQAVDNMSLTLRYSQSIG